MSKGEDLKRDRVSKLLELDTTKFIQFKGAAMVSAPGTNGFVLLNEANFAPIAYEQFGTGVSATGIRDMLHAIESVAPDWSDCDRYVAFVDRVWDRTTLSFADDQLRYVYSTSIALTDRTAPARAFLLQLAKGDEALAHDYLQGMAALFMMDKPTGIIWFVGDGANGKSSLLKALYRGFGRFFVSLTTADLEDGRDIPSLRGMLGNIVLEASEARVSDSKAYKSIGSHETMRVHAFNKQSGVAVDANFHTIFNANNIPTFADKTGAIRRRTWTLPFPAHFPDNPRFEQETFTPEFLGGLFQLILETAVEIRDQGNRYVWSPATMEMKRQYDEQVNSCEAFIAHLLDLHLVGVYNYSFLERNYKDWCANEGHIPLSIQTLKRTLQAETGVTSRVMRDGGRTVRRLVFDTAGDDLTWEEGTGYAVNTPKIPVLLENQVLEEGW
jgi:hypothetical protein